MQIAKFYRLSSNLSTCRRFMQFCATLTGQTINYAYISKNMGLSVATVKNWLAMLERSYILFLLPPYFGNFGKRLVKSPKLYFYDTGLVSYLLELETPDRISVSHFRGALFENMVVAERMKRIAHAGHVPRLYFFRDNNGLEADLLEESPSEVRLTEIKATATYQPKMSDNLNTISKLFKLPVHQEVVYGGNERFQSNKVHILPWHQSGISLSEMR